MRGFIFPLTGAEMYIEFLYKLIARHKNGPMPLSNIIRSMFDNDTRPRNNPNVTRII